MYEKTPKTQHKQTKTASKELFLLGQERLQDFMEAGESEDVMRT